MSLFDISIAERDLNTAYIGRKIVHKPVTVTTMNDAEDGARQGNPNGTVYIADMMTGGRGTKGRKWVADSNENLYMSIVLHIRLPQNENPMINRCREFDIDVAGALASLLTLEQIGVRRVKIKWLNDLWIRGHKIMGALTEYKGKIIVESQEMHVYILGIGLNINSDMRRDPEMHHLSSSVMCELGHKVSRETVFAKICNYLEPLLETDRQELLKLYKDHEAIHCGDVVKAYMHDNSGEAYTFSKVREDWSVELIGERREPVCFQCTEVSLRPVKERVVYILDGPDIQSWSSDCLLKSCNGLVDSQKYEVKSLSTEKVSLDKLLSCALIIIGQIKSISTTKPKYVDLINDFVQNGGSCLAIGNACMLFKTGDNVQDTLTTQDQRRIPSEEYVIKSVVSTFSSSEQHATMCLFPENDQLCHHHSDTKCYEENNELTPRSTDIVIADEGKGKICLSRPNIEISYADLDEYFPSFRDNKAVLLEVVHHRDRLFLDVFAKLLT